MGDHLSQYFKYDPDKYQIVFEGESLEVRVPRRYENHDLLVIADDVRTLAIFELIIDDKHVTGCLLPAVINMEPSDTYFSTIDGVDYAILQFTKGDIFISNTNIVRNPALAYAMFVEFISLGNMPRFLSYNDVAFMFDTASDICGMNFPVNHAVFEMIYSHLFRDPNQLTKAYRLTDMTEPPAFVQLRSVSYGPDTTTARLLGSYIGDGIDSSLVHQTEQRSELEDLLRS